MRWVTASGSILARIPHRQQHCTSHRKAVLCGVNCKLHSHTMSCHTLLPKLYGCTVAPPPESLVMLVAPVAVRDESNIQNVSCRVCKSKNGSQTLIACLIGDRFGRKAESCLDPRTRGSKSKIDCPEIVLYPRPRTSARLSEYMHHLTHTVRYCVNGHIGRPAIGEDPKNEGCAQHCLLRRVTQA